MRKALYTIGKNLYQQKMSYGDDRLINFILFRVANSFKFIREYGIIYYYTKNSIVHSNKTIRTIRNCNDELINLMNIFKFTKNSKDYEFAVFEVKYRWNKLILPGLNRENKNYAIKFLEQILNSNFINKENKEIIYNLWNKTINKI